MDSGFVVEGFTPPPSPRGVVLLGRLVRLEPLDPEVHARDLFEANSHDGGRENWDYLPYGPFDSFDDYKAWLDSVAGKDDPFFFAIIRASDNRAVGVASFLDIDCDNGNIEVGHVNYSPLLQRTKEGTEAMWLMMQWAFENGYRRYQWRCNSLNAPSRYAAQRLGLSFEGVFRQRQIVKGRNRDTAWFAAIDSEWPALQQCFERYLSDDNFDEDNKPLTSLSALTRPILVSIDH